VSACYSVILPLLCRLQALTSQLIMSPPSFRPIVATCNGLRDVLRINARFVLSVHAQWKDLERLPGLLQSVDPDSLRVPANVSHASPDYAPDEARAGSSYGRGVTDRPPVRSPVRPPGHSSAHLPATKQSWQASFEVSRERVLRLIRANTIASGEDASSIEDDYARDVRLDNSLAIYATEEDIYITPLPYPVDVSVFVDATPCLAPLLRFYSADYAVGLALHDGGATLFTACNTENGADSLVSRTMQLNVDEDPPMISAQPILLAGMQPVIRWLREIDVELERYLPRRNHPVVLFGDRALCNAFASLNLHRSLVRLRPNASRSDFDWDAPELDSIRTAAANHLQKLAARDLCRFQRVRAEASHRTSVDGPVIATEASLRRIETLFVDEALLFSSSAVTRRSSGFAVSKTIGDGASGSAPRLRISWRNASISRIERTVAETLIAGGTVHAVRSTRLPVGHHVAAIFRY